MESSLTTESSLTAIFSLTIRDLPWTTSSYAEFFSHRIVDFSTRLVGLLLEIFHSQALAQNGDTCEGLDRKIGSFEYGPLVVPVYEEFESVTVQTVSLA